MELLLLNISILQFQKEQKYFIGLYVLFLTDYMYCSQLERIVEQLQSRDHLIVNQKYDFDVRNIIMNLPQSSIDILRRYKQITLDLFVDFFKNYIQNPLSLLIYDDLVRLFQSIDVNRNQFIEWREFVEYLAQCEWAHQEEEQGPQLKYESYKEKVKYRKHLLRQIVEINNKIVLIEDNNTVSAINTKGEGVDFRLSHLEKNKVLSIDYCQKERTIAVLTTKRKLHFLEEGQMQKEIAVIQFSGTQKSIHYLLLHNRWLVQSLNGQIQIFSTPIFNTLAERISFRPHSESLTAICEISHPLSICTGSMDGTIRLWGIDDSSLFVQLEQGQSDRNGIKNLCCLNRGINSVICSWVFTNDIYVWMPSLSKPYIGELKGHFSIVQDCCFQNSLLFSLDAKLTLKQWNVDRLVCLQSTVLLHESCSLYPLTNKPIILVYSRTIHFYKDKKYTLPAAEQNESPNNIIALEFCAGRQAMILVTEKYIALISVNEGAYHLVDNLASEEVHTAFSMKEKEYYLVATSRNIIYEYRYQKRMKAVVLSSISGIVDSEEYKIKCIRYESRKKIVYVIVEGSRSSRICLYREEKTGEMEFIKEIQFQQVNIGICAFSEEYNMLVIGSEGGAVTVWNTCKLTNSVLTNVSKFSNSAVIRAILINGASGEIVVQTEGDIAVIELNEEEEIKRVILLTKRNSEVEYVGCAFCTNEDSKDSRKVLVVVEKDGHVQHLKRMGGNGRSREGRRNSLQLLKEVKKVYLREEINHEQMNFVVRSVESVVEKSYNIEKGVEIWVVLNKLCLRSASGKLEFYNQKSAMEGEWDIDLRRVRKWNLHYNQFQEVMRRVKKAVECMKRVKPDINQEKQLVQYFKKKYYFNLGEYQKKVCKNNNYIKKNKEIKLINDKSNKSKEKKQVLKVLRVKSDSNFKIKKQKIDVEKRKSIERRVSRVLSFSKQFFEPKKVQNVVDKQQTLILSKRSMSKVSVEKQKRAVSHQSSKQQIRQMEKNYERGIKQYQKYKKITDFIGINESSIKKKKKKFLQL